MKRFMQFIVTICLVFSARTFAALGNSESEIAALFGDPVKQGSPDKNGVTTNTYQKGNYIILVQFLRHLSLAESYTREDQQEFSEKEIAAFLEGSSNDRAWNKDPNKLEWERSDHKARAWCQTLHGRPTLLLQAR